MNTVFAIFAFLFGAAVGSFLNVIMYRLPLGRSIVKPRSFCPHCKKTITAFENIPIISYIVLRGRCSGCKTPISLHYPAIELITGALFVYFYVRYNISLEFFAYSAFSCALIVISGIDFSFQIIPDIISIPGIFAGLVFQLAQGNFLPGLIGAIFGGGLILLIRIVGGKVYRKEVMGMGDVYLTAMIGAFVGWPLIIVAVFLAALIGSILGIIFIASTHQSRESPIPFGPFLSLGGIAVIIFYPLIIKFFAILGVFLR
jgi:leader peptidase (prepilin peptidase)/N-methyltransferase